MIVDLMRNDLGQICDHGTVSVTRLLSTEIHPGLAHLVSEITGELQADTTWPQVCEALLPPGSVSGAPKSSAQDVIFHNEPTKRGPYCGALGWVEDDQALLSVAIRIFWSSDNKELHFGTGAGITWGVIQLVNGMRPNSRHNVCYRLQAVTSDESLVQHFIS